MSLELREDGKTMNKLLLAAVAVVAYVLGTRAGRTRYNQIRSQAQRIRDDPRVQEAAGETVGLVKGATSKITRQAADAANEAAGKVKSAMNLDDHGQHRAGQP